MDATLVYEIDEVDGKTFQAMAFLRKLGVVPSFPKVCALAATAE